MELTPPFGSSQESEYAEDLSVLQDDSVDDGICRINGPRWEAYIPMRHSLITSKRRSCTCDF